MGSFFCFGFEGEGEGCLREAKTMLVLGRREDGVRASVSVRVRMNLHV